MVKIINPPKQTSALIAQGVKNVQKILNRELKVIERLTYLGDQVITKEEEDLRLSFIQSVESLTIIANPYFDDTMIKALEDSQVFLSGFGWEIFKAIEDKELLDKIKELPEKKNDLIIDLRVKHVKVLFAKLNLFIQRTGLFKDKPEESEKHGGK